MRPFTRVPWQTQPALTLPSRPLRSTPLVTRHQSTTPPLPARNAQPIPTRLSPYRLLQTHHFLQTSAPLLDAGWRLESTTPPPAQRLDTGPVERADLKDRRLLRVYPFNPGRQGYEHALSFVAEVGELIQRLDVSSPPFPPDQQ